MSSETIAATAAPRNGALEQIGLWFETAAAWLLGVIWIAPLLYAVARQGKNGLDHALLLSDTPDRLGVLNTHGPDCHW